MAKTIDEIVTEAKSGLTGEEGVDMLHLEHIVKEYANTSLGKEVESRMADLAYEILSDEKKEKLSQMIYIDGKRLDAVYAEALALVNDKKIKEAHKLTEALYTKIRINFRETEDQLYLSIRNPLEHQLYLYFYSPSKTLQRAPFDLCAMVMLHGYVLLDLGKAEEAVAVLEDAIRYNPINSDPYFEMAECYKMLKQPEDLLGVTKETISIATSPITLSRCYCNLGYYCIEIKDYDSAVCFYYESLIYADHPGVQAELHHIHTITKKKLTPPTRKEVNAAFEKYGMKSGASEEVTSVTAALAKEALEKKQMSSAQFYLITLYGLTNDPEIKALLEQISPKKQTAAQNTAAKPETEAPAATETK
jgi:tetratricopeptide (TPR) repeat protein